jgi:hypothetical protein
MRAIREGWLEDPGDQRLTSIDKIDITTYPRRLSRIVLIFHTSIPPSAKISASSSKSVCHAYLLPLDPSDVFPLPFAIAEYETISAI